MTYDRRRFAFLIARTPRETTHETTVAAVDLRCAALKRGANRGGQTDDEADVARA